jgi:hypothetical protein
MNAEGINESAMFEDLDENISLGPANSVEPTFQPTSQPTSEDTSINSIGPASFNEPSSNSSNSKNSNSNSSNSNSSNSNSSNSNSSNTPEVAPVEANRKGMSVAAKTVLGDRMKTLAEMREAYAKAFGNDPKAPKAKSYEAFALTKVRKEQGEEAFQSKLQEYIERNQGIHAAKPAKGTRKKVMMATNAVANTAVATNAATNAAPTNQGNSRQKLMQSVRTMADSAKDLIETIVSATMSLSSSNTGDMTSMATRAVNAVNGTAKHRKVRSNKGKTHKMSAMRINNSAM